MANYASTIMPKLMAMYAMELQKKTELRTRVKPFISMAMQASDIIQPAQVIQTRESDKRPIYSNWLIKPTSTSAAARETTHTGPNGDSSSELLTWTTLSEKLSWTRQQSDDNLIPFETKTAVQIQMAIDKIMSRAETAGIAYLEAAKSGVNANNGQLATFNAATDVLEIAGTDVARSPYIAVDNMKQNNYEPGYSVIADSFTMAKYRELLAQGQANAANNGWQMFNDFDIMDSYELTPGAYVGISYWFPKFSIGMLDWIPAANRRGEGDRAESYNGILSTFQDARYPGINFAVSIYTRRTDMSGAGGSTQSYVTQMEISLDVCFKKAELSTATETVIHAVGQLA